MIIKHPRLIIKRHGTIKNYRYIGDVSLISPGTLARLAPPAVLTRLVAPLVARVTAVPASSATATSAVVTSIIALGATTEAPIADGLELLAVVGVVVVHVVEDAERAAALDDFGWS